MTGLYLLRHEAVAQRVSSGELADAIGALEARVETAQRTDKPLLLKVLGITAPRLHPH